MNLRKEWEDSTSLIVRISQIESLILNTEGVIDITNTVINEQNGNIEIGKEYIPILGNIEIIENEGDSI